MERVHRVGAPDGDPDRFAEEWDDLVPCCAGFDRGYYEGTSRFLPDQLMIVEALRRTSVVGLAPFFSHQFVRFTVTSEYHPDSELVPVFIRTGETEYCIHTGYFPMEECPCVAIVADPVEAADRFAELVQDWWMYRAGRAVPARDRPWQNPARWPGPSSVELP